jgi:ubiquinone/menaquinone biosynthesis C-methylase UbiE
MIAIRDFLSEYLRRSILSTAMVRAIECRMLSEREFSAPVLDLGCGDGTFASVLFSQPVATGFDISSDQLEQASTTGIYNTLVQGDAWALPFAEGSFATVLCNSVLEHIPNPDDVFLEVRRILREDGRFLITVPTPDHERLFFLSQLFAKLGMDGMGRAYGRMVSRSFKHYNTHSADEWSRLLEKAGFKVTYACHYLPPAVVALHDLFSPLASVGLVKKHLVGRSYFFPALRRPQVALLSRVLRRWYQRNGNEGGYVLIEAQRAVQPNSEKE